MKIIRYGQYYTKMNKKLKRKICAFFCKSYIVNKHGCEISFDAEILEGLRMPHLNGIIISPYAKIGRNCTIFHQVTIGTNEHKINFKNAPNIGDNVYIGAGVKLIGNIRVGNNVKIGSNAVVTKDVPDNYTVVGINKMFLKESERKGII